jgi:bacterioferritin-associated ferredoxin
MIVCICHGINEKAIHQAVADGACTMSDLACQTGVATCCGKCADCAKTVLDEALCATYAQAA